MGPGVPDRVPQDGIPSPQHVLCTAQLGVTGKFAQGALHPTVLVTDKQHQSQ